MACRYNHGFEIDLVDVVFRECRESTFGHREINGTTVNASRRDCPRRSEIHELGKGR